MIVVILLTLSVSLLVYYRYYDRKTVQDKPKVAPIGDKSFDYTKVEPEKFRPFNKPNKSYKWSMSLTNITANDIFVIDQQYLELIKIRKRCLQEFPDLTMGFHESCIPVILEFYHYVFDHMCQRYPMYFRKNNQYYVNDVTGLKLPFDMKDANTLLQILGQTITEDFMMLLDNNENFPMEYCLRGFTGCAPGGVDSSSKLNKPITIIHEPIPGFLEKLRFAMLKFFNRLKPTQFMMRNNWFIQYSDPPRWFFFVGETEEHEIHPMCLSNFQQDKRRLNPRLLDFNQVFFRNEKQCFIKLPKTGAVLMLVKTYLTALNKLRDQELLGQELSDAIDGIQGNPRDYKGVQYWGNCMKKFLKRETNGITDEIYDYEFEY